MSRMAEVCLMTQSERWQMQYEQVMAFIATNHPRPSKYYAEERLLWHRLRRNIKERQYNPNQNVSQLMSRACPYSRFGQQIIIFK